MSMRNERGFTLVEVMVAMAILVTVVLGMLSVYKSGFFITQQAGDRTQALNFAQQVIEEKRIDTVNLTAGVTSGVSVADYTYKVNITDVSTADYPDLYQVAVTVDYITPGGSKKVSLTTFMRKR